MTRATVYAIFPTPIYTVECDIDISSAVDFLNKPHDLIPNNFASQYGNKSIDDYILDNPECKLLKEFIVSHIEKYAGDILAWEFENFQITQSWITIKEPNESHGAHYHPNSMISAVFFFQEDDSDTESLKFLRPAIMSQLMNQFAPEVSPEKMKHTEFPWNEWYVPPKKNSLVIFPSWLSHGVDINKSLVARKTLAVNSIPTKKFGSRMSSAEIDISRLK